MSLTPLQSAIVAAALSYKGKNFRAGLTMQCMNFTRAVLAEARSPLASIVTTDPLDGYWTGPELASSLAGLDIGTKIAHYADARAGDICFFLGTFDPGPPFDRYRTITHVGIAVGQGQMVHRPTVARPVEIANLADDWHARHWGFAIRPHAKYATQTPPESLPQAETPPASMARVYLGPQTSSRLIATEPIVNGRIQPTLAIIAAVAGCKLIWNEKEKAARFEPAEPVNHPLESPINPRHSQPSQSTSIPSATGGDSLISYKEI